jgi:hypothetical protein
MPDTATSTVHSVCGSVEDTQGTCETPSQEPVARLMSSQVVQGGERCSESSWGSGTKQLCDPKKDTYPVWATVSIY